MSKFSMRLKEHIEGSRLKIYQIAKNSGLDRTTIQRVITGERLPSIDFVNELCKYLQLSFAENKELLELYSISKIGEDVYLRRQVVKEIIYRLATISPPTDREKIQKKVSYSGIIDQDNAIFSGQYTVEGMIRNVLDDEVLNSLNPKIYIFVPLDFKYIYDFMHHLFINKNKKIAVKSLIRISKDRQSSANPTYNLRALSQILPFAFVTKNEYFPYYYYEDYDPSGDISLLVPYYIITSNRVIKISSDFKKAVLHNNMDIVNLYQEHFDQAVKISKQLTEQYVAADGVLLEYLASAYEMPDHSFIIEPQPCISWYFTRNTLEQHIIQEIKNRDYLIDVAYKFYKDTQQRKYRPISIFSVEGLKNFMVCGILENIPSQIVIPFSQEERVSLIKNLISDIKAGIYPCFAAKPDKFCIPNFTIELYNKDILEFNRFDENGACTTRVEEKSIVNAFYDFFESLPQSGLLFSKEETVEILEQAINKLNI